MKKKKESKIEKMFFAVADFFNSHNVMTDTDFNDICDDIDRGKK